MKYSFNLGARFDFFFSPDFIFCFPFTRRRKKVEEESVTVDGGWQDGKLAMNENQLKPVSL